jgi:twitching motility two-component system response regulator PilH
MGKVLVVEDSRTQREMISQLLKANGMSVMFAGNGIQALKVAQWFRPELVVLDIILPRMNGYEVCRRLKSDGKTRNLAVIMCSIKTERFDLYWAMKQGADAYIAKPFRPQELIETVKFLLRR